MIIHNGDVSLHVPKYYMMYTRDRLEPGAAYGRCGLFNSGFWGAIFLSACSKASGDSSAPNSRAVFLNSSDCCSGVMRFVFCAGFMDGV